MVTMADRSVVVDTNVLLTATHVPRPWRSQALIVLNEWPNRGIRLLTCGQILREYLVVATRPADVNGLGLRIDQSLENVEAFLGRMDLVEEGPESFAQLAWVLRTTECSGKQIHDANLVAIALARGAQGLVTANPKDFERFSDLLSIQALADVE